jgi:hypothetical protein
MRVRYKVGEGRDATGSQKLIAAILKQAVDDALRVECNQLQKWTKNGKQLPYPPAMDLSVYFRSGTFQTHLDYLGYDKQYFFERLETKLENAS